MFNNLSQRLKALGALSTTVFVIYSLAEITDSSKEAPSTNISKYSQQSSVSQGRDYSYSFYSVSNSMSEEKIIAWFCAGALGYATFYAIGKNIAEK